MFTEPLNLYHVVYKTTELSSWNYTIPETIDPNYEISVDVKTANFVDFSERVISIANLTDT